MRDEHAIVLQGSTKESCFSIKIRGHARKTAYRTEGGVAKNAQQAASRRLVRAPADLAALQHHRAPGTNMARDPQLISD
jgi:hypothetical protein